MYNSALDGRQVGRFNLFESGGGNVYAIVQIAGYQYRVAPGAQIRVEQMSAQLGAQVKLDQVLLVSEADQINIGKPLVAGASVTATVVKHMRGDKLTVFDYRPNGKRHRVKTGHRQSYTWLRVDEIVAG
jgi:large subunit ribosomal protein L21